jgi:hypothetical protein
VKTIPVSQRKLNELAAISQRIKRKPRKSGGKLGDVKELERNGDDGITVRYVLKT